MHSTYFKTRRKMCANTRQFLRHCRWICVLCRRENETFNGMFILWAFSLKERTDCYASETFAVMGHNLRKHLDMLDYCPSTPSPFHVHSCSFGNSFQSPVFKYYLCVMRIRIFVYTIWNTRWNSRPINSPVCLTCTPAYLFRLPLWI